MRRALRLAFAGALLACATGCRGNSEALFKEYVAGLNELAASFENNEPPERQQAAVAKLKVTSDRLRKLRVTRREKDELMEKYRQPIYDAASRLGTAARARGPEAFKVAEDAIRYLKEGG